MRKVIFAIILLLTCTLVQAEIRVPAFTAYLEPVWNGADVSKNGITEWNDTSLKILWFGELKTAGKLDCSVSMSIPAGVTNILRLTVAGQSNEVAIIGKGTNLVQVRFGSFDIKKTGYQKFVLEAVSAKSKPIADVDALVIDGAATQGAHFNMKQRRNAASVHLTYPVDKETKVTAFYCEVTGVENPLWTYFMACGWHRGYFGMQVISPTERNVIFSVWDSGDESVSRDRVSDEDRVKLLAKGDGVVARDFGNEGTGGHSHWNYNWKTGEKQRFLVTAKPVDATHTIYTGYYFHPEKKKWMLISSWKAPKDGDYLRGLYSFSEDFIGDNGHLVRKALFGNQWIRSADGKWTELTTCGFSHDSTGKDDRLDRYMGVENGQFFLSHGGFVTGFTKYGTKFSRLATGQPPTDFNFDKDFSADFSVK